MDKLKYVTLVIFFVVSSLSSYGKDTPEQKRLLKRADDYYRYYDFKNAIIYYEKYLKKSPENALANYHAGMCYEILHFEAKAYPYYKKAYQVDPKVKKDLLLRLGSSQHANADFKEAIESFTNYLKDHSSSKDQKVVAKYIDECKNGIEYKKNAHEVEVINLGKDINSPEHDHSPVVSADGKTLIFSSVRRGASEGARNQSTGQLYADLYMSTFEGGKWQRALPIDAINTTSEEGSVYLSPSGNTLLVYVGVSERNSDLFISRKNSEGGWSPLIPVPGQINSPSSREVSATMSEDQLTMIFSSDRNSGEGGIDLYISKRRNISDDWGKPKNISALNTEYDEDSPFLDIDGKTLYFCSNGHKGMGRFDIYRTQFDSTTNEWSEPMNLGYPINSPGDDIFFIISHDGKYAYFNSAKEGGEGGQDLYRMTIPEEIKTRNLGKEEVPELTDIDNEISIRGKVMMLNYQTVEGANVKIVQEDGSVLKTMKTGANGVFAFDVETENFQKIFVVASKPGHANRVAELFVDGNNKVFAKDLFFQESVPISEDAPQERLVSIAPNVSKMVSRNIYFDFNSYQIKPNSYAALERVLALMEKDPSTMIEIHGHTDNVGSEENNLLVSQKRSRAILNYLVSKGADRARLISRGLGESQPLVSNDDEHDGREVNRRIEFIFKR